MGAGCKNGRMPLHNYPIRRLGEDPLTLSISVNGRQPCRP